MFKLISIYSFRRGTGKTCITANLAVIMASAGLRVGMIDLHIQAPSLHIPYNLQVVKHSLNDFLSGGCDILEAVHDVTPLQVTQGNGKVFLVPASTETKEMARGHLASHELTILHDGLNKMVSNLKLDVLLLDANAGLNEEALFSVAISDVLLMVMRPDRQDFHGTAVALDIAQKLEVPNILMVANIVPLSIDIQSVRSEVETVYRCEVAAVLPYSDELMALSSSSLFALRYPYHVLTMSLKQLAEKLRN